MTRPAAAILIALLTALAVPCAEADAPGSTDLPSIIDPAAGVTPGIEPPTEANEQTRRNVNRGITPFVAPVPFKHTQLGWGLALMLGGIHSFDRDSTAKPSTGAIGGFYSENKSWGVVAMEMARLGRDKWRLRGLASYAKVRYDFYGIGEDAGDAGRSIGIEQEFALGNLSALYRIAPGFYVGPQFFWMQTTATPQDTIGAAVSPTGDDLVETDLAAPGIHLEFDSRDDDYWPTHGSFARVKALFFTETFGGSRAFERYVAAWSWYGHLRGERLLLATNVNAAAASGNAPFYALPSVGAGRFALRGYTQGRYRDKVMTTAQAELRFHTRGRLGFTAFGGFGQVAPTAGEIFEAEVLPAGGAGVRVRLTRLQAIHFRFDVAWGKDGAISYFGVTEVF